MENKTKSLTINNSVYLVTPDFEAGNISFYSGENASKALKYLSEEVDDKLDNPNSLKKARYQLRKGDSSVNHLGLCCGHFKETEDIWIVFDNSTGNCWVEEFSSEEKCLEYLGREEPENDK